MIKNLYRSIGKILKNISVGMFILESIIAIIFGLLVCPTSIGLGLLCVICCPILAFILSIPLYALGEIIDLLKAIERNTRASDMYDPEKAKDFSKATEKSAPSFLNWCFAAIVIIFVIMAMVIISSM